MPVARRYGTPQVATTPMPRARKSAAHTADTLGAGVERAKGQRAETIGAVGGMVSRIGTEAYQKIQTQQRERADAIAVLAAENNVTEFGQTELVAALERKKLDAFGLPEEFDRKLSDQYQKIRSTLSTQRQQDAFDRVFQQRLLSWKFTIENHVSKEIEGYYTTEFVRGIENDQREAITFGGDGTEEGLLAANTALTRAVTKVREHGKKLGMGPEAVKAEVERVQIGTHAGIVDGLLASGKDVAARAYFDEAVKEGQLKGEVVASLAAKLDTASTNQEGFRASEEIWKQLGPQPGDDKAPINLDVMEARARELFKDDEKKLAATVRWLRERKAGVDAGRQDRKEAVAGALWGAVAKKATLADIQRMPEYLAAPGALQEQISNYIVDKAEQAANRAYAREVRAEARLSRADAARARAERAKEEAGWVTVWRVTEDRAKFAGMTENQIVSLLPDIGVDNVNRLIEQHRALNKSADAVREATIDDDLFKVTAREAGLDAYSPKTDAQRAELGILKNTIETEIDLAQRDPKGPRRQLNREEKQAIMRRVIDTRVMINTWGSDESKIAAMVVDPDERDLAYVPIEHIPQKNLGEVVNIIRSMSPAAQRMTPEQIQRSYKTRIQRAYAAFVLGLGDEEIRRRLREQ